MKDYIRQSLNLVLGLIMWLCSSLNLIFDSARSPADMSDANDSLLVPAGIAFSIWFPIFVLCGIYAVLQALPKNRTREVYRRIGWWSAAGFAGVCAWGIINAFAPLGNFWLPPYDMAQWGTAIVFVPTMLFLVKAMLIATREKAQFSKFERNTVWGGLSLIAGWCSIAVFLNWTPQMVELFAGFGIPIVAGNLIMLICALVWAVFITRKSALNRVYAFPIIWGLSFAALARFTGELQNAVIGGAAVIGVFIVLAAAILKPKTRLV